jgi:hypothetical protein
MTGQRVQSIAAARRTPPLPAQRTAPVDPRERARRASAKGRRATAIEPSAAGARSQRRASRAAASANSTGAGAVRPFAAAITASAGLPITPLSWSCGEVLVSHQ